MTYEEAIEKMARAIADELYKAGAIVVNVDPARAAAEAIGLREMMEAQKLLDEYKRAHQYLADSDLIRRQRESGQPHPVPDHSKSTA